jgi:hypothetical protein
MECKYIWEFLYLHPATLSWVTIKGEGIVETTYRFSASCRPQQLSQKNLFRWHNISLALNWRKHAVTLEFCSISIERSRNDSSREDTFAKHQRLGVHGPESAKRKRRK